MTVSQKNKAWGITAAILSASFLQTMASSAISPVLSILQEEFNQASPATIQLAMTLPSVFIMLISFFVPGLLKRFSIKQIVIFGIVLYLVGGIGGAVSTGLVCLLLLRSVMGVGLGLFSPMLPTLISQSFQGQSRTDMMGYLQSFNFLGGMIGTAIGGMLAVSGWRNVFWVYLFGIVAFILTLINIKDNPVIPEEAESTDKSSVTFVSWCFGAVMVFHGILLFKVPLSAAELFAGLGIQDTQQSGMAVAVLYGGSFLSGMLMGKLRKLLKMAVMPLACLLLAAAFLLLGICASESYIFAGAFLLGFGSGLFAPMLYAIAPEFVPAEAIPTTMTILNAALYLGMFLSPYASILVKAIGIDCWEFDFYVSFGCELILALAGVVLFAREKGKTNS